jgi:hypothetical protein
VTKGINDLKKEIGIPLIHGHKTNVRVKKGYVTIVGMAQDFVQYVEEEVMLTSIAGKKKKVNRKVLPLRQENRRVSRSKSRRMKSRRRISKE